MAEKKEKIAKKNQNTDDIEAKKVLEKQKTIIAEVTSNKVPGMLVLKRITKHPHPKYRKIIYKHKKLYAQNDLEGVEIGDSVIVRSTRPLSKLKRWVAVSKVN